jgi:hypothetical protein
MFSTDIPLESRIYNKNHGKIPEYNINSVFGQEEKYLERWDDQNIKAWNVSIIK